MGGDRPLKNPDRAPDPVRDAASTSSRRARTPRGSTRRRTRSRHEVLPHIQRASNYVLGVVLFASALFFAGMSTKLTTPRLRVTMLCLGCGLFVCTAVWMATSPISLSV